jgi:hypothetical protein
MDRRIADPAIDRELLSANGADIAAIQRNGAALETNIAAAASDGGIGDRDHIGNADDGRRHTALEGQDRNIHPRIRQMTDWRILPDIRQIRHCPRETPAAIMSMDLIDSTRYCQPT